MNYDLPFDVAGSLLDALFRRHIGDEAGIARALYLPESMIREMARAGMTFGYHTRRHRVLARLSEEEQRAEIEGGVGWIRGLTGQPSVPVLLPARSCPRLYAADRPPAARERVLDGVYGRAGTLAPVRRRPFELPRYDTRNVASCVLPAELA